MIPADKLTEIAEGIAKDWGAKHRKFDGVYLCFSEKELADFTEIVLACGAAHEAHQRKHGR